MEDKTAVREKTFQILTIGQIRRAEDGNYLEIIEAYRPALKQLGHFSHVLVLWWAEGFDNEQYRQLLQTEPPYAPGVVTGVFATRSPYRPNPVTMTTCKIHSVDEEKGLVRIGEIDAYDGTYIIDLKAYFPVCDRVKEPSIPSWLEGWPEWMPDEGLGLME